MGETDPCPCSVPLQPSRGSHAVPVVLFPEFPPCLAVGTLFIPAIRHIHGTPQRPHGLVHTGERGWGVAKRGNISDLGHWSIGTNDGKDN